MLEESIAAEQNTQEEVVYFDSPASVAHELPTLPDKTVRNPELEGNDKTIGLAIAALAKGESVLNTIAEAHQQEIDLSGQEAIAYGKQLYADEEMAAFDNQYDRLDVRQDNPAVIEQVQATEEARMDTLRGIQDTEQLFFDSISRPEVGEEMRREQALRMKFGRLAAQTIDDMNLWDWAANIGGLFIPGKQLKDNIDVLGNPFGGEEAVKRFFENYMALPAEEKEALLPVIQQEILSELPELRAAQFFQALSNPAVQQGSLGDWNVFWASLDAAEVLFLGGKVAGAGIDAYRTTKAFRSLAKFGDADDASKALASGLMDETGQVVDGLGIDELTLVNNATPFKAEHLDPQAVDGLSAKTLKKVREFEAQNNDLLEGVMNDSLFLREGILTQRERMAASRGLREKYAEKYGVENVEVYSTNDRFIIKYNKTDDQGNVQPTVEQLEFDLDRDTGELLMRDPGVIGRHVKSALAISDGEFRDIVRTQERLDSAQSRVFRQLQEFSSEAAKAVLGSGPRGFFNSVNPFARKKLNELNAVLLHGDAEGQVYTARQLKDGVGGIKLDENQIEAYFKVRRLADTLYILRNAEVRKTLRLKGMQNVNLMSPSAGKRQNFIAKPLLKPNDARNSVMQSNGGKGSKFYFDAETGQTKAFDIVQDANGNLGPTGLDEAYANGKVLVKFDNAEKLSEGGTKVRYALVDPNDVSELPEEVLHKLPGYIPKINDEAAYFVKVRKRETVDGQDITAISNRNTTTVRAFDNRKEAEEFAEELNMEARDKGMTQDDFVAVALEDRQLEQERMVGALDDPMAWSGGGLYTGPRSSEEIRWGKAGEAQPRVNAFDALNRNLASVSRFISRNETRLGMEARAIKTANYLLQRDAGGEGEVVRTFKQLRNFDDGTRNTRIIREMVRQIDDWNSVPTAEEKFFKSTVQGILDSSVGKILPGLAKKGLHNIKSKDPVGSARAAAFHGLLGWFNPVQMWVQAQGAAVAASMNIFKPGELGRVLKDQFILQILQHMDGDPKKVAHAARSMGMKEADIFEMNAAWQKSGLADAVLQTADHAAAAQGHGIAMSAISRAADKGLFFYRAGELFNRRLAFTTSYRKWKEANKGKTVTDDALREIVSNSNNLLLNLGKSNKAAWQKGFLSVPTQFAQVNAKTVETLLGANGNFDLIDRGKILTGQLALYGAAGIPLGNLGAHWLMEMTGVEDMHALEKEVGAETVKMVNEGMLGWATMAAFGVDVEIGNRSALLGGVNRFAFDLMYGEGTTAEKFLGAFGNTNSRFWDGVFGTYKPISLAMLKDTPYEPMVAAGNPFLASISTFRNIDKAIFMHNMHRIVDQQGGTVVGPKDFPLMQEIFVGAGFRDSDEVEAYTLQQMNDWYDREYLGKVSNDIVKLTHIYMFKHSGDEPLTDQEKKQLTNAIQSLYLGLNERDQARVRQSVQDKIMKGSSKQEKEIRKFIERYNGGLLDQLMDQQRGMGNMIRGAIGGGGLKRFGLFDEEEEQ